MKNLSSNGREESRTNKGRTSKLSFVYILAAFFLSFGLMFAGSVTSYANDGEDVNNSEENPVNEQTMTDEERAAAEAARLAAEKAAAEQAEAERLAAEEAAARLALQQAAEEEARLAAERAAAEADNAGGDGNNNNGNGDGNNNQGSGDGNNNQGSGDGNNNQGSGDGNNNQGSGNGNNNQGSGDGNNNQGSGDGNNNQGGDGNNDQQNPPAPAPKISVSFTEFTAAGTTVSDGLEGTGRLAGYSTSVNHYKSATGDEITSILLYTNDDSDIALTVDDFDLTGIDPNTYEIYYDIDCGVINIVKRAAAAQTGTSSSGSSTSTTVYYKFTEVTEVQSNQDYYYVPYTYDKLTTSNAVIGVPYGTARLNSYKEKSTDEGKFGTQNNYAINGGGYSSSNELQQNGATYDASKVVTNVNVEESGTGFDGCKTGTVYYISGIASTNDYSKYNGLMGYWCSNSGARAFRNNIFGRLYTYELTTVTSNSLKASVKPGAFDSVGTGNVTISDTDISKYLDVSLTIGDKDYVIGGCTVVDGTLNYRKGDNKISIKFGDTTKEIYVDLSNLAKLAWEEDHKGMREATSVSGSDSDIAALQRAIAEGLANSKVDANSKEMQELSEKLAAAIWQKNNQEALSLDETDPSNYYRITYANAKYGDVNDDVKQYMSTTAKGISKKQELVEKKVNDEAEKFMAARLKDAKTDPSDEDTNPYADATAENTDKILASKGDYDKLAPAIKKFIDEKYTKANKGTEDAALTYAEIYERAQNLKDTADAFVEKYASILVKKDNDEDPDERETYNRTNTSNYAQIISGANAWKNLTEEERKYINKALNLGNGEAGAEGGVLTNEITFEKLLADAYALRELLNRPAYVAYEDTYDGPEEVYPVFLPKKEVKKEEPVVVETKTEHNTKKQSTENGSSKKTTDDSKLRKENDNALEKIFNNLTKKENEKTDVLSMLEKTVNQIASSITETAKATFGNGAILINVQSWLANTESGEGMWTDSSARNKNLAANESQVSYTLENADRLAASVLTASELNYVNNGDTMEIRLRINPNEEKVSQEHKNQFDDAMVAVQDSFVGLTKGEYLDISLEKRRNNGAWQYIPETEDAVRIAIDVPANLVQSGRTFFIIRNHDGECTILRDLDDNDETLTIETDRFSDYLVIYDDNFAESAKNAASGTLYGSAAGTTPTYNNGNTNVIMYVATFLAILFMVIVVMSMRRRDDER